MAAQRPGRGEGRGKENGAAREMGSQPGVWDWEGGRRQQAVLEGQTAQRGVWGPDGGRKASAGIGAGEVSPATEALLRAGKSQRGPGRG